MDIKIVFFITFAVFLFSLTGSNAQDPVDVNPGKYTVVFENEYVRLLEYKDNPGDKSVMHEHPDHLVYSMSEWEREFTSVDGTTTKGKAKPGDAFWAPGGKHFGKNIGTSPTHALIFELKNNPGNSKQ